jgi:hypothetical protein
MAVIVRGGICCDISTSVSERDLCGSERVSEDTKGSMERLSTGSDAPNWFVELEGAACPCSPLIVCFPDPNWRSWTISGTVKAKFPPAENPLRAIR